MTGDIKKTQDNERRNGYLNKRNRIVDGVLNFLDNLRRMLHNQRQNWGIYFAHSVDAALEHISRFAFDAIVFNTRTSEVDESELLNPVPSSDDACKLPGAGLTKLTGVRSPERVVIIRYE